MSVLVRFSLAFFTICLLVSPVPAQLVPLVLEETITLPANNTVWDVIPHTDGYFYFIQAAETADNFTTIFIGRTDQPGVTEFAIAGKQPRFLQGFYYGHDRTPTVYLENHYVDHDSTQIRVIDLESGAIMVENIFRSVNFQSWPIDPRCYDYGTSCVLASDAPPFLCDKLSVALVYNYSYHYHWFGDIADGGYSVSIVFPDIIEFPDSTLLPYTDGWTQTGLHADNVVLLSKDDLLLFSYSGKSSEWGSYSGHSFVSSICSIRRRAFRDTTSTESLRGVSWDPSQGENHSCCEAIASSYDSTFDCHLTAAIWERELNGLFPSDCSFENWTVPQRFNQLFAADIVDNDGHEEILGYQRDLDALQVYRWQDGYRYGQTSEVTPNPNRIAIIGRYSSELRRLALQYDNQLFLYSFSEYLDTDSKQPAPVRHEAIRLSTSPQPAVDQVQFMLSSPLNRDATLVVYDLLGREVHRSSMRTQSTSTFLNLSALPSGVYFAALDGQPQIAPHKFIVLK